MYRDLRDRVVNNVMKEYYRYTLNTIIWEHKKNILKYPHEQVQVHLL